MHCCCGCVWPCGLHSARRTHHRWWCLGRRARAVALTPRGGEVRVCESTVRGLSGSSIAGRSECTAAAAGCGLAACTARRALTKDRWAQRAESPAGRGTRGRSERSRLPVEGLVGATSGVVATGHGTGGRNARRRLRVTGLVGAARGAVATGHGTGGRNARRRLRVMGLVGAASGVVCWSWDWWAHRAESSAGRGTGRRSERSRLLVEGLVGTTSGVVCWSWD